MALPADHLVGFFNPATLEHDMKPSLLKQSLRACRSIDQPVFIWGPPGVGKSDVVAQLAKEDDMGLIDFCMALRGPTDLNA
jgi:MoxR-like ATPase